MGKIIDGVYNFLGDAFHCMLRQSGVEQLKRLVPVLEQAATRELSREQVISDIETTTPELRSIADALPQTRHELYVVIGLLIALVSIFIAKYPNGSRDMPPPTQQVIEQHITNTIELIYRKDSGEGSQEGRSP